MSLKSNVDKNWSFQNRRWHVPSVTRVNETSGLHRFLSSSRGNKQVAQNIKLKNQDKDKENKDGFGASICFGFIFIFCLVFMYLPLSKH